MAGNISTLNVTASSLIAWSAQTTDPILGARKAEANVVLSQVFSNPVGTNLAGNQCIAREITVPAGTGTTVDLTAAMTNILDDATATIGHVKAVLIWLPSVAQNSSVGSAATSITIGNAVANQSALFGLGATDTITLKNGRMLHDLGPDAGYVIDGTHLDLLITNNDGAVDANVILVLVGNDT